MKLKSLAVLAVVLTAPIGSPASFGQQVRHKGRSTVRFINPPTLSKPTGYSHVAVGERGRMILISGQVALDNTGKLVGPGDFAAQTEQVFKNLKAALESAGASFNDVAKITILMVDRSKLPEFREIRDRYVNKSNPPTSSLMVVKGLARDDFLIEVEATAFIPE